MDNKIIIKMLEELMEVDEGTLLPTTRLAELEEFDSMARLSLIVMMNDEFEKKLSVKHIKEFRTIQDIIDFIHA